MTILFHSFALFLTLLLSKPLFSLSGGVGDFIFDRPIQNGYNNYEGGSVLLIEWHIEPRTFEPPKNFTLKYRLQNVAFVGNWTTIVEDHPYQKSFIWTIPKNASLGLYILSLTTSQKTPNLIRDGLSPPFSVTKVILCDEELVPPAISTLSMGLILGSVIVVILFLFIYFRIGCEEKSSCFTFWRPRNTAWPIPEKN
jgi:hypothetical protein